MKLHMNEIRKKVHGHFTIISVFVLYIKVVLYVEALIKKQKENEKENRIQSGTLIYIP